MSIRIYIFSVESFRLMLYDQFIGRNGGDIMQNFNADSFKIFDREWALLTAGNQGHYNTMTIS